MFKVLAQEVYPEIITYGSGSQPEHAMHQNSLGRGDKGEGEGVLKYRLLGPPPEFLTQWYGA